ncbi:hypothetical protein ACHAXR_005039, partial [Thalassiosira sp. AJA248-18]
MMVDQMLAMLKLAEDDLDKARTEAERKMIEELCCFVIIGFCVSLRGEEVPLVSLEGLLKFWEETKNHRIPHVMIPLRGRFKGEQNLRWHCVPIGDQGKSKIPSRRWISRLLLRRVRKEGAQRGYLFARKDKSRASLGDYDDLYRTYMERTMQRFPSLFSKGVDVKDYSLRRSLRRGSTTTATNNNVDPMIIELINRWRKKEAARGAEAGLPMRQVYTQVSNAIDAM